MLAVTAYPRAVAELASSERGTNYPVFG